MPRTVRRALIAGCAVGLAALTLSGCSLPFTTPIAVPTIPATPLPAAPSTTPPVLLPTGPAPALANTGSNWASMIPSLLTYGQWLLANPAAAPVSNVAAAGCPLTRLLTTEVSSLSGEGWRLAPSPLTISSLSAATGVAPGTTAVTLQIQASRAPESIVDATGQATSGVPALPPATFDLTVVLGGDGKWRLCSAQPGEPVPTVNGADQTNPSLL